MNESERTIIAALCRLNAYPMGGGAISWQRVCTESGLNEEDFRAGVERLAKKEGVLVPIVQLGGDLQLTQRAKELNCVDEELTLTRIGSINRFIACVGRLL